LLLLLTLSTGLDGKDLEGEGGGLGERGGQE
jgi:hypothetical protein